MRLSKLLFAAALCFLASVHHADAQGLPPIDTDAFREAMRARAAENRKQRELEAAEQQRQALEQRAKLAEPARGQVFELGMRVCKVNDPAGDDMNLSVDEFNTKNGRIRIVSGTFQSWADAKDWFPCSALK